MKYMKLRETKVIGIIYGILTEIISAMILGLFGIGICLIVAELAK